MIDATQLIRDLRIFADPATDFQADHSTSGLRVQLIREGLERDYTINLYSGETVARHDDGRRYVSIPALLASEEFVDLRSFRATQRRILGPKEPDRYIEPEGQILHRDGSAALLSLDAFRRAISHRDSDHLAILLLDGPAGIGKTSLIERMVFERADPASSLPPLLHVTSSGSRLTDLSKALAHATQLLRAHVTFDQVPVLVRIGVLQVAIDGFDELVDPEGYKDAWSALRQFLGEIRIGGPVVLAGRDTFFDQQSFEQRLASRIPNLELAHARLQPISPAAAKRFLKEHGWSDTELKSAESREWLRTGSYHLRPFFLAQIGSAGSWSELEAAHGSPQSFLVTRFVTREASIVSRMVEISVSDAEAALWDFYGLIVEDMATQEADTVDEGFLALACETAFQNKLAVADMPKLVAKAGSFGLLESDGGGSFRRFPHSELQNQFLARVLIQGMDSSAAVSSFLRRGLVNAALVEAFSDVVINSALSRAENVRARLARVIADEPFSERLTSNCGALLLSTLSRADLPPLSLESISVVDAKIIGTAASATLKHVTFSHLDVRGADCRAIDFSGCDVTMLTVDPSTYFGHRRPATVRSLQIENLGLIRTMHAPNEISDWLEQHSSIKAAANGKNDLPLVRYFERLCRKFVRQHQIRSTPSDEAYFLLESPFWPEVRQLLGDRIQEDTKSARGPHAIFYRMVRPEAFLALTETDADSIRIRNRIISRALELASPQTRE
jgi:hypothetical protein